VSEVSGAMTSSWLGMWVRAWTGLNHAGFNWEGFVSAGVLIQRGVDSMGCCFDGMLFQRGVESVGC